MAREPFAAQLTSIWLGAIFFWLITGFRGNFKQQLIPKYKTRNLWTGYVLSAIGLIVLIYYIFVK